MDLRRLRRRPSNCDRALEQTLSDYEKLIHFCDLIGVPIKYGPKRKNDAAYFVYAGKKSCIEIFGRRRGSLGVLTLLHELGHAFDWITQGRPEKTPDFLGIPTKKMTRKQRYQFWLNEKNGINNTVLLHNLLRLTVPKYKLETERMVDLWTYNCFYQEGKYPPYKVRKKKWHQIHKNCIRLYSNSEPNK